MNKQQQTYYDFFSMPGEKNLHGEQDLGIINGHLTTNVLFRDVLSFRGLYAPPFVSSDFILEIRLCGEKVPTQKYTWFPIEVRRQGVLDGLKVESELVLAAERRALVLAFTVENTTAAARQIPLQFNIKGGLDYNMVWEFAWPTGTKDCTDAAAGSTLLKSNESGAIAVATDIKRLTWQGYCWHWDSAFTLPAKSKKTFHVVVAMGKKNDAVADRAALMKNPRRAIAEARRKLSDRVADLFTKLPTFQAQDKRLETWYNRSLVHLILNQWQVPEFKLHPYYSTGGINGGCACSYLWDFGETWEIFSLYDPAAAREHIKAFLNIDLTRNFAFLPITGEGFGPWYYINQEKIIFHIYYYVLHTGDVSFLHKKLNGKTIIDHAVAQALVGDMVHLPAVLVDYGTGNHHLELRKKERYDNYLPDVNARRYAYYYAVDTLCKLAGVQPPVDFPARAEAIKRLVRADMWSPKDKWFYWLDAKRNKHLCYTVQMFKLFSIDVLDRDQEAGLLGHLTEKEFLSDYGLHSMAKHDLAYDQVDIDNGGGGCYTGFPPLIAEKLYRAGHPDRAEDILKRILWWGDRLAYWGDSFVANHMDYRKDTPLQNTIGSLAAAQSIIFGMFGVQVQPSGQITINPVAPSFSSAIRLSGLKIRNYRIDIAVKGNRYVVTADNKRIQGRVGTPVTLEAKR